MFSHYYGYVRGSYDVKVAEKTNRTLEIKLVYNDDDEQTDATFFMEAKAEYFTEYTQDQFMHDMFTVDNKFRPPQLNRGGDMYTYTGDENDRSFEWFILQHYNNTLFPELRGHWFRLNLMFYNSIGNSVQGYFPLLLAEESFPVVNTLLEEILSINYSQLSDVSLEVENFPIVCSRCIQDMFSQMRQSLLVEIINDFNLNEGDLNQEYYSNKGFISETWPEIYDTSGMADYYVK